MKDTIVSIGKKIQYEATIFLLLAFELIIRMPAQNEFYNNNFIQYVLSYRLGFSSRFFIGSVIQVFTYKVTVHIVWMVVLIAIVLLISMVSLAIGRVIRFAELKTRKFLIAVTIVFLASPASISYLFYWGNYGRLDLYLLMFTVFSLAVISHPIIKWLVPFICVIGMATHQIYLFYFITPIVIIVLYDVIKTNSSKQSLLYSVLMFIAIILSFITFQFVKELNVNSPEQMLTELAKFTDEPLSAMTTFITYEYYSNLIENFKFYILKYASMNLYLSGVLTAIFVMPLFVLIIKYWLKAYRSEQNKKIKFVYFMIMLSPLSCLPPMIMTLDWGRWFAALFLCQFCLIYYFNYRKESSVLVASREYYKVIGGHPIASCLFILYLSTLGKFEGAAVLALSNEISAKILSLVSRIVALI